MLYPANFEQKLGFDKIRELIANNCISAQGTGLAGKIKFLTDRDEIVKLLRQASEFRNLILSGDQFPLSEYFDYGPLLVKASKYDAWLLEEEFHNMKISLSVIEKILHFFSKRSSDYPELALLTVGIYLNPNLLYEINHVIDEHGHMKDNASPELEAVRRALKQHQLRVRRIMEKMLKDFITEGYSNDDANVTIRNGRLVLPVRSEFKRSVGGFIHDESATGLTAFIEPASALEVNNEILDLEHQEKREMVKILSSLTDRIRPEIPNLQNCLKLLGDIDFIRAKARVSLLLEAAVPEIDSKPRLRWSGARHPLLYLSHKSQNKTIVPLDIELTPEDRILIISGPNAGGKSVCLKTVGLIQYMMQCGLPVPLSEASEMGIFTGMLADIGDEQSIENDLSTYSSHLIGMKTFISNSTGNTLFLIDEFGTGTEPQFGGAIAESILEHLIQSMSFGIITTHYTNLKKFAEETSGAINGAMRFDLEKM
ncbi:MAG TPA: hypothetical protein VI583_17420, partial [Cyclobacteriaceae bacterium]|nr:hypothetical protein [Cyclobacteriaceae bacterium]